MRERLWNARGTKEATQLSLTQVDEEHRRTPSSSMLGKKTPRRSGTGEVNSARLSLAGRELRASGTSVGPPLAGTLMAGGPYRRLDHGDRAPILNIGPTKCSSMGT